MAVYTHPRFRRDDYASVCEMDGGHRSRTRGNSNPDLSSADFAMSMAGGGGGVGLGGLASFHSTGSLSLASAGGGAGRAVQLPQDQRPSPGPAVHLPPQHPSLLPGPLPGAHAHRQQSVGHQSIGQSSIDVAVSAAQEMSLELQLQDTNRMLMQLNDLQSQFAAGMNGGGSGSSDEKIDFSSIDAGAMNSAVSAQPSQSSGDAGTGMKKPSRDDPDALAAFMGMRRTSLGYMPYLPTSSRRGSNISSVSDASNLSDNNPFADFPDHSCPVTNPVDDMRDDRFHRGGHGGSLAGLLPQGAAGGPTSPPPVSAPPVPSASVPGETFEVDIMAQVRDEFERAASDAASSVGVPSSSDGVKKEKVAA